MAYFTFRNFCRFTSHQHLRILQGISGQQVKGTSQSTDICISSAEAQIQRHKTPWKVRSVFAWWCQVGIVMVWGIPSAVGCLQAPLAPHIPEAESSLNPGSCWLQIEFKWQNPWRTRLQGLLSQATAVFWSVVLEGLSPHLFYFLWERH